MPRTTSHRRREPGDVQEARPRERLCARLRRRVQRSGRVTAVRTGDRQYKTSADAKRGLAFWRKEDAQLSALDQPRLHRHDALVKVPAVGKKRFADLTSFSASNIAPVSSLDEQVADGRYVLEVTVSAGSASAAKALAPKLAKKLDARLRLALAGRLHAKPVKLPAKQKAGPPTGGPDLSTMALQTSDLSGPADVVANQIQRRPGDPGLRRPGGIRPNTTCSCCRRGRSTSSSRRSSGIRRPTGPASTRTSSMRSRSRRPGRPRSISAASGTGRRAASPRTRSSARAGSRSRRVSSSEFIDVGVAQSSIDSNDVTNLAQTAASKIDAVLGP